MGSSASQGAVGPYMAVPPSELVLRFQRRRAADQHVAEAWPLFRGINVMLQKG
jgi:hypothetical protein